MVVRSSRGFEDVDEYSRKEVVEADEDDVMNLLRQTILGRILNRIDEVIMFKPLMKEEKEIKLFHTAWKILKAGLSKTLASTLGFSDYALDYLAQKRWIHSLIWCPAVKASHSKSGKPSK